LPLVPCKARDSDDPVFCGEGPGGVVECNQSGATDDLKILSMGFVPM
jgi:hypothetical protein